MGIRPEQLPQLFQSFGQLDPSTTRVYGGTGLGLAISRPLAELMGGAMWAESAGPGRGATFSFRIDARPTPLPSRPYLRQRRPELAGRRVLIVDDTPTNRRILQLQLQTWGMRVVEAATPGAALDLAASLPFDLAILDMDLPEMDGVALAEALRAALGDAAPPMLMLTSLGQTGTEPCLEIFAACLSKPVKPSQLYDALVGIFAGALAGSGGAEPLAEGAPAPLADRLPLRILVAEDVAVNQKFALLALEDLGYRADVVANGLEALTAVARQPYDVVLMDVQMPELDGLEATRRIHQLWGAQRDLPTPVRPYIVAMTANALQGDREHCLEAGMDDYISKPVYLGELRATLERAGAARSASAQPPFAGTIIQKLLARPRGQELLALYAAESAELVARLREAAAAGDSLGVRAAAHSLKGSSRYVGAETIAALCVELEQRAAEPGDALALVAALGAAHARALAAITELSRQEVVW
jgi:CheY-like chemotaxis protein